MSHSEVFNSIYENRVWGDSIAHDYIGSSGWGSDISFNINTYIPFVKGFIGTHNIRSVVDLGCGDFRCGKYIYDNIDVTYHGFDAYDRMINSHKVNHTSPSPKYNFHTLDFLNDKEKIPAGDLCILKDVLQHWCLKDINMFLDYLVATKRFKYILITNCQHQQSDNEDVNTGGFRPLTCNMYPLKKYDCVKLITYATKEVCLINRT
jgi:hypothetical protein